MKKKILSVFLVGTMVTSMLVGCGAKATADNQEVSTETEVTEETEEAIETEVTETVESETDSKNETVVVDEESIAEEEDSADVEEKVESYETFVDPETGCTLPKGDTNNEFVKMLHDAGLGVGKFDNAYIEINEDKNIIYIVNPNFSTIEFPAKYELGFEEIIITEEDLPEFFDTAKSDIEKVKLEIKDGNIEEIDFNHDGFFSWAELALMAIFYGDQDFTGCLSFTGLDETIE